jgi:hypothetical protein
MVNDDIHVFSLYLLDFAELAASFNLAAPMERNITNTQHVFCDGYAFECRKSGLFGFLRFLFL